MIGTGNFSEILLDFGGKREIEISHISLSTDFAYGIYASLEGRLEGFHGLFFSSFSFFSYCYS